MIFRGKPSAEVEGLAVGSLAPIILFGLLTMLIACLITTRFSDRLVRAIRKMELLEAIRTKSIVYGDVELHITMTFGLTEGNGEKIEHIVRDADEKLYRGKNSGRNQIVV